ncbi:MAG: hypothetical protein U1F56_12375 [Rubrivivax sp.]
MKPTPWSTLTRRLAHARAAYDARAPRERLLVALALSATLLMVVDRLWMSSAMRTWNEARAQQRQVAQQVEQVRAERARQSAGAVDPAEQVEIQIRNAQERLGRLERDLRAQASGLVPAGQMVGALEQLLAAQPRVRVRSMKSLPRTDLLAEAPAALAASSPASSAARSAAPPATLYRHGVEVTLEGDFADLVAYLRSLDTHPQQLIPGGLQFRVEKHPLSTLTLRLHTLSMDRHWLEL